MSETIQKDTVTIEIDGKEYEAPKNANIIEVADREGIHIPRFCYHKKLSIAANCRMCLVDVEGARRPCAACATPIMPGMKIRTKSKLTRDYQKSVMEFLLINHPLDCPICDQGGECELQDQAVGYGKDVSRYTQGKRSVPKKNIGPLVDTDLIRCIQCTRCVRFGEEIVGRQELGLTYRGEHEEIATFLEKELDNELSGNIIDLCPVGALTNKPFRYQARAWELRQHPMVSPHDCVGSNFYGHIRRGDMMRIVPRENESVNEVWLSDRDRYSMYGLNAEDRITKPMIKRDGEWETVSWEKAMDYITSRLQGIKDQHGGNSIGGLASVNSTTEELYLFQKLLRALGSDNIDHRLQQMDFAHQSCQADFPGIDCELIDIEKADRILLFGSNIRSEQPIINVKLRKATLKGAEVNVINPADFELRFDIKNQYIADLDNMLYQLAAVTKAVLVESKAPAGTQKDVSKLLATVEIYDNTKAIAKSLLSGKAPMILVGAVGISHPHASLIHGLLSILKQALNAKGGVLTHGANTAGAWLAGTIPHRGPAGAEIKKPGNNTQAMVASTGGLKAYLLLNVEPQFDSIYGQIAATNLKAAELVVAMTPFAGQGIQEYADVMLPIATYNETSGTYINVAGTWQSFTGASVAAKEVKPAWKVLRVLANFMSVPDFQYLSSQDVLSELKTLVAKMKPQVARWLLPDAMPEKSAQLQRVGLQPVYATDNIVRRSQPLLDTQLMKRQHRIIISDKLARTLRVDNGEMLIASQRQGETVTWPVHIDASLPENCVMLPTGLKETANMGMAFGAIELTKE